MSSVAAQEPTALVLTALPVEMTAVLAHLSGARSTHMAGPVLCEAGHFAASGGRRWRVVAAELGPGNVDVAGAVPALVAEFRPDVLMFVGIAGALKDDLNVGDVVAGTEVAWTERGKWSSAGYQARVRTVSLSVPLSQMARKIAREGSWTHRLPRPLPGAKAVVAQIASGEKVVADREYRAWLRATVSDALAIDNESFALARAGEMYAGGQRYVVRGISDKADGSKSDDGHEDAAAAAAAFAFELLEAYISTLAGGSWAVLGAAMGAVAGSFALPAHDESREREALHAGFGGTFERIPPESWARLLDPRRELVGFVGRADELAALGAWCEDDDADRLRIVTGPGGVGKTRLAVELAERMKKRGWVSERVADGQEPVAIAAMRAVTRARALLVVDYAETRVGLRQMLTALASDQGAGVRVLLLARSLGDWWDQLGTGEPAAWDLVLAARSAHLPLSPTVATDLSDTQVIGLAVTSFARVLGLPERTVEVYGDSGASQRRVLDLHAAALVAVLAEAGGAVVRVDIGTVLGELLRHEQHFWYSSADTYGLSRGLDGTTTETLRQIVAAGCLLGAASQREARALPGRVPGMAPSAKVAGWLRVLYPPDSGETDWIGSMQPDRLAELHTMHELVASPELARACLTNLDARQGMRAVSLLARASADYPEAETMLSHTLPDVADLLADLQAPVETLSAILSAIPYPTVVLAPAAVSLGQRITRDPDIGTDPAVRAYWLSSLGSRLSELGRPAEALPAVEQAVAIRRQLAATDPDRYQADLANSLLNLGVALSDLGRPDQALTADREAVAIRRQLAAADPGRYRADLAAALDKLGGTLSALSRPEQALPVTGEAAAIRAELAAADPGRYRADLAVSLDHLGIRHSALGHHDQALPVTEEAAAILRELAATDPDRHRPDLANALTNLAATYSDLGRADKALAVAEEAATICRQLATASPDRYHPSLADALRNLGVTYSDLGHLDQALAVAEEATAICRQLAATSPDRHQPGLADSLKNVGATLLELGRPEQALPAAEEAAAICRHLATANPDRHQPRLADTLSNISATLVRLGRPEQALPAAEEAAAICRHLAAASPERYQPGLASSLINLGVTLSELGRTADALAAEQKAVAIYRQLAAASPGRPSPGLAMSLDNLGVTLFELGRAADALAAHQDAVAIYRQLAAANPDRYQTDLLRSQSNLAEALNALSQKNDATTRIAERPMPNAPLDW